MRLLFFPTVRWRAAPIVIARLINAIAYCERTSLYHTLPFIFHARTNLTVPLLRYNIIAARTDILHRLICGANRILPRFVVTALVNTAYARKFRSMKLNYSKCNFFVHALSSPLVFSLVQIEWVGTSAYIRVSINLRPFYATGYDRADTYLPQV